MALGTEPINMLGIWHKNLLVHIVEIGARSIFHIHHPLLNPVTAFQHLLLTLAAKQLEDFIRNNMSRTIHQQQKS
jgi:anthranilate phosphoribosyltransferase